MIHLKNPIGTGEAARIVGETQSNFLQFIYRNETPPHVKLGGRYLFEREDIINWIKPVKKAGGDRRKHANI